MVISNSLDAFIKLLEVYDVQIKIFKTETSKVSQGLVPLDEIKEEGSRHLYLSFSVTVSCGTNQNPPLCTGRTGNCVIV